MAGLPDLSHATFPKLLLEDITSYLTLSFLIFGKTRIGLTGIRLAHSLPLIMIRRVSSLYR
jgi:hypothetical protein